MVKNIQHAVDDEPLEKYVVVDPPAIHMSLGIVSFETLSLFLVTLADDKHRQRILSLGTQRKGLPSRP